MSERGKYVVIEGHDGTGKSTQVSEIRKRLSDIGIESVEYHEPSGTPISSEIRSIIVNGELERDGVTNVLLFSAARHEIWNKIARPAMNMGKWVVASRNWYSTLAYQGYGEDVSHELIERFTRDSTDDLYMNPDLAIILNLDDAEERQRRIGVRGDLSKPDTFESRPEDFQTTVREAYLDIATSRNLPIVSANQHTDDVTEELWGYVQDLAKRA